jgi:iron complex outermembrane receptor protein
MPGRAAWCAEPEPDGELQGSIYDQTGAALPAVEIRVAGAIDRDTRTDDAGRFVIRDLPSGDYALRAALDGFEPLERLVRVPSDEIVTLSLTLRVAVLAEVVVTAGKVGAGDLQSLPLAITAVPGDQLTRLATPTIDQAAAMMPSVTFTQNGTFGQLSIRGIGTNAVNAGADPSSAMYLDGVYLARPAMAFVDFIDLERVEVLRGPQGTLYGRNAVGGALNLISRPPTSDFEATARVTVGNLDERRVEARVSGALLRDRVMGSVAFGRGVRDGYVRDLEHLDHPLGGDNVTAARGQLLVVLDRRTSLLASADVTDQNGTLLTFNKVLQVKPGFVVDSPRDLHEVRTSTPAESGLLQYGAAARLTSALTPSMRLVSLSAFRMLDNRFVVDADITELPLLITRNRERQHQLSQELTISRQSERLTWVSGLFLFREENDQALWVDQSQARAQIRLEPLVDAASSALFGEATIDVAPRLSLVAGLRYTHERKEIDNAGGRYTLDPPIVPVPGSRYAYSDAISHSAWTPRMGVELQLPDRGIAYVSATRGFKSGGFNLSSTSRGLGFAPEWAWSFEGGVKLDLFGGRARMNAAAFHMDYTNLQVQTPVAVGVFDIGNAASATVRGVELEAGAGIGRGLTAAGHVAWLDATYDHYVAVAVGGTTGDVAGKRLNNAPQFSGRASIEWTGHIGGAMRLSLAAEASAQSTVYYTPFNDAIQRQLPYGLLGARAELGPSNRRWAINLFGRNLADTDYIMATFGTAPTAFGGRPALSRQFGVQLAVRV